jgi:hypothetical protein
MTTLAVSPARPADLRRGLIAGGIWGLIMSVGLPVIGFFGCGMICLSDIANTAVIAVPAGFLTITPLVMFATPKRASSSESR